MASFVRGGDIKDETEGWHCDGGDEADEQKEAHCERAYCEMEA